MDKKTKKKALPKQAMDAKKLHPELTLLNRNHTEYPSSPDAARLETFINAYPGRDYIIEFDCPEYSSNCPVTGQPDYGHIYVRYIPDKLCIESKALKLYLFSFRNFNTFHEEAVNRILTDLSNACKPRWMEVYGDFMPRGGISIKVRASVGKRPEEL